MENISCQLPNELELTLQEMAEIALGVPEMKNLNVTVLHSLIDLILKKLDCQYEKVSIGGFESKCLESMLRDSRISPLPFNDENFETVSRKFDKVVELQEHIDDIATKLDDHFQHIRDCNHNTDTMYRSRYWERYAKECEDLCTIYDPENRIPCELVKKPDFVRKLMGLIGKPMEEKMISFQKRVEKIHKDVIEFMEQAEEQYKKMSLIYGCIIEIENVRNLIENNRIEFEDTLIEVQDMLDAKLDKIHVPALKRYFKERIVKIENTIEELREKSSAPQESIINIEKIEKGACLSCLAFSRKASSKQQQQKAKSSINSNDESEKSKPPKKSCYCAVHCLEIRRDESGRLMQKNVNHNRALELEKKRKLSNLICLQSPKTRPLKVIAGKDGRTYRAG